jgi:6-phosphogluconolactonase
MRATIKIFDTIDKLSHFFAEQLVSSIEKISEGSYFSIALSGGSSPKAVFSYLASNYKDKIPWGKILILWGDERCVPPESDESNYKMARESLLDQVPIPSKNIFKIMGEKEPIGESWRYSEVVRQHVLSNSVIPQFDLIMLGLGEDGHTASIYPGDINILNNEKLFDIAENPYTKQKRISATFKIINQASSIIFLVTGKSKAEMLARIIEKKEGWEKLPASMVNPVNGEIIWLLDTQSASGLNRNI